MNSAIPSFRNRIYSGDKVIPEIRLIYPWNRVIPPFSSSLAVNSSQHLGYFLIYANKHLVCWKGNIEISSNHVMQLVTLK